MYVEISLNIAKTGCPYIWFNEFSCWNICLYSYSKLSQTNCQVVLIILLNWYVLFFRLYFQQLIYYRWPKYEMRVVNSSSHSYIPLMHSVSKHSQTYMLVQTFSLMLILTANNILCKFKVSVFCISLVELLFLVLTNYSLKRDMSEKSNIMFVKVEFLSP